MVYPNGAVFITRVNTNNLIIVLYVSTADKVCFGGNLRPCKWHLSIRQPTESLIDRCDNMLREPDEPAVGCKPYQLKFLQDWNFDLSAELPDLARKITENAAFCGTGEYYFSIFLTQNFLYWAQSFH